MHGYAIQPSAGLVKLDAMENPFRLPPALQRELGERLGRGRDQPLSGGCVADVRRRADRATCDLPRRLQADARQRLRRADRAARDGLRRARRHRARAAAGLRDVRDVGQAAGPALRRRAADAPTSSSTRRRCSAAIERAPAGDHLHRLPEQPDREPVRRARRSSASSPRSARRHGLVVFDEAYQPFASRTWMQRMARHEHVLVMRTLQQVRAGRRAPRLPGRAGGADRRDRQGPAAVQHQRAQRRGDAVRARACRRVRAPGRASFAPSASGCRRRCARCPA